jgi:hypothetical protein
MFDLASRAPIGEPLIGYGDFVGGVALTEADRRVLVVGAGDRDGAAGDPSTPSGAVRIWDIPSEVLLHDLTVANGRAGQLALIRLAGRPVAVTFGATRARLWDVGAGKRMASFRIARTELSAPVEIARFDCTAVATRRHLSGARRLSGTAPDGLDHLGGPAVVASGIGRLRPI